MNRKIDLIVFHLNLVPIGKRTDEHIKEVLEQDYQHFYLHTHDGFCMVKDYEINHPCDDAIGLQILHVTIFVDPPYDLELMVPTILKMDKELEILLDGIPGQGPPCHLFTIVDCFKWKEFVVHYKLSSSYNIKTLPASLLN